MLPPLSTWKEGSIAAAPRCVEVQGVVEACQVARFNQSKKKNTLGRLGAGLDGCHCRGNGSVTFKLQRLGGGRSTLPGGHHTMRQLHLELLQPLTHSLYNFALVPTTPTVVRGAVEHPQLLRRHRLLRTAACSCNNPEHPLP